MKKHYIVISLVLLIIFLLNYTAIMTNIIYSIQYREHVQATYPEELEPKERIAEISIAALESMGDFKAKYKGYEFLAIDASKMPNISDADIQQIIKHFKAYHDKPIHASLKELKSLGLCTLRTKTLRRGILLSIDDVIEITNEKAVLKISDYASSMGASGYICTLVYEDNQWQLKSLELKFIA